MIARTSALRQRFAAILTLLALAALLLGGCDSALYNAPAPLAADVTIPYAVGATAFTSAGITTLRGRDGNDTWHAATGDPSTRFTPLVAHGVVYAEGGSEGDLATPPVSTLVAVRLADGQILWRSPVSLREYTIATDGETVLVATGDAGLDALDAATGKFRWHMDGPLLAPLFVGQGIVAITRTDPEGQQAHLEIYRESDGRLIWGFTYVPRFGANASGFYASDDDVVFAYALQSGADRWQRELPGDILIVTDQAVIVGDAHSLTSLDAATGRTLWTARTALDGDVASMVIAHTADTLYGAYGNQVIALRLADGHQLWRQAFDGYTPVQVMQQQGVVFAMFVGRPGSGSPARIIALDGRHGALYWQRDISALVFLAQTIV
jgi:outer membrane protein assembly factor BamB